LRENIQSFNINDIVNRFFLGLKEVDESFTINNLINKIYGTDRSVNQDFSITLIVNRLSNFNRELSQFFSINNIVNRLSFFNRIISAIVNFFFGVSATTQPNINLNIIYPLADINVTQNQFFNVTVNVSCSGADCGEINVSLDPETTWCYQETANVSTVCGGLDTGSYYQTVEYTGWYDGNWSTGDNLIGGYFVNYSKPTGSLNTSLWQIKDSNGVSYVVNLTLPEQCWVQEPLQLKSYIHMSAVSWFCWNSTNWTDLRQNGGIYYIYEEAMWWEIEESSKSGLISTTPGATPFYTNATTNPWNISLNKDESQLIVFWVNATGTLDTTHEFFVYANKTSDLSINDITSKWNVTITTGVQTYTRSISVSFGIEEIIDRLFSGLRDINQLFNLNSIVERLQSLSRGTIQGFSINDIITRLSSSFRNPFQSFNINNIINRLLLGLRTPDSSFTVSDGVDAQSTLTRETQESFTINNVIKRLTFGFRTTDQSFSVNNIITRLRTIPRNINQEFNINHRFTFLISPKHLT
jgi:hypothetical protein